MRIQLLRHIIFLMVLLGNALFSFGQTCKIGDVLINRNDRSKGVVFWVNPERTGGWMIAMTNLPQAALAGIEKSDNSTVPPYSAIRDTAGYSNTAKLRGICLEGDYNILRVDFEHGWYIPACGQLWQLGGVVDIINLALAAHGREIISTNFLDGHNNSWYLSSSPGKSYAFVYDYELTLLFSNPNLAINRTNCNARAVRSFTMSDILIDTTLTYRWNTGSTTPQTSDTPVTTTTYTVTVTSQAGCSDQASGNVFVANADHSEIYDTIRRGEIYTQNGFHESEPGTYTRTIENGSGCSTELILYLSVLEPLAPTVFNETICAGQIYSGYNFTAWESGVYTQQWTSHDGRDSTVILNLIVQPTYLFPTEQTLCYGQSYDFRGRLLDVPGVYYDSLKTKAGCDSVFRLTLDVRPELKKAIKATICGGERFTAYGFDVTEEGIYTRHLVGSGGCDSTITLHLIVQPINLFSTEHTLCHGQSYDFRGRLLNAPGIYHDSLRTESGCDSVYRLTLNVLPELKKEIKATICAGERFTDYGFDVAKEGIYTRHLVSGDGCDSTITLHLIVQPNYLFSTEYTLCHGQSYDFRGRRLNAPGIYYDSLRAASGCDSVYRLILNVRPEIKEKIEATICAGERFTDYGFDVAEEGVYTRHLLSGDGCDSTITLHLIVQPLYLFFTEHTLCHGETYAFRDRLLDISGIYHDSLRTESGCDSIYRLTLNVLPELKKEIKAIICAGERYTDYGFDVAEEGIYTRNLISDDGCDSSIILHLIVQPLYLFSTEHTLCHGQTYAFRGRLLDVPGIYHDSLRTESGCDSVYQLTLNVLPELKKEIKATICAGERYTDYGFDVAEEGIYTRHLASSNGCDTIVTLNLSVISKQIGFIQATLEDCAEHTYQFTFVSEILGNPASYFWDFGDKTSSEVAVPMHSYADSGRYIVKLVLNLDKTCHTEHSYPLIIPYYPESIEIHADRFTISNQYPELEMWTEQLPGIRYQWDMGDGSTIEGTKVIHSYDFNAASSYIVRLTATNSDDCQTEQTQRVKNDQVFIVPNTFSPNGDGINDVFIPGYQVKIMDRNGLVVYKGDEGWDGCYKGNSAPEDCYFYVLYLTNDKRQKEITGYIHLIR